MSNGGSRDAVDEAQTNISEQNFPYAKEEASSVGKADTFPERGRLLFAFSHGRDALRKLHGVEFLAKAVKRSVIANRAKKGDRAPGFPVANL